MWGRTVDHVLSRSPFLCSRKRQRKNGWCKKKKSVFLPAVGAAGSGAILVLSDGEDALVVLDLFFGDVLQEDVVERWPVQDDRRVPTAVLLEDTDCTSQ